MQIEVKKTKKKHKKNKAFRRLLELQFLTKTKSIKKIKIKGNKTLVC